MALTHIAFNDQLPHGRLLRRSLQNLEDGNDALNDTLATMVTMLSGDGTTADHFTYMVPKFGFPTTAEAKAGYEEVNALIAALASAQAALVQAFDKFR